MLVLRKEFDLYYYLFNIIDVIDIQSNKIEFGIGNNKDYNTKLVNIISDATKNNVKVSFTSSEGYKLKDHLISELKSSNIWNIIEENFNNCEILDIIHKNG